MIKIIREIYCDACGKRLDHSNYIGSISIYISFDTESESEAYLDGYDFCEDCMRSFNKWKEGRRNQNGT